MTQRGRHHYLTLFNRGIGWEIVLSIVFARNADDAAAITGRAEGVSGEIGAVVLLDSKEAYTMLRHWFKRSYVRQLQTGHADHLAAWRFAVTSVDDMG